jgi:eukaryotic-like serine/threonine-protein kinase
MELLEGETLQQRLAASAPDSLPPPASIDVAIQVCLGLEAAHGKDIVHRDIKPANIFLTRQGTVKLLDFGVAKLVATAEPTEVEPLESAPGSRRSEAPPSLTRTGVRVGTAAYMSPEQLRREQLDGRSDLFSVGLVLYEMATGRRAFTGETAEAVHEAILATTPPAANEVNAAVPRPLAAIVVRALEKDRTARYQTAADMRQDLERARAELLRAGRRRNRWLPVAVAVPALAIAAVGAWISWRRESSLKLAPNDTIVLAHLDNATSDGALAEALYLALRLGLEQTPCVKVLAEDKLFATLGALGIDASSPVTPDVASRSAAARAAGWW